MEIQEQFINLARPVIKVIGVGGGGCNAINHMIKKATDEQANLEDVEYIATNTDAQVLEKNSAKKKIQLGAKINKGNGVGGDPQKGRDSAEENRSEIEAIIADSDMLFITTGLGGGTGTGASPVIAEIAQKKGILTVAVVSTPFNEEGEKRQQIAQKGVEELRKYVDSLIVVPNSKLEATLGEDVPYKRALRESDEILRRGVKGIVDIVTLSGEINIDFADIKKIMSIKGDAMMGIGSNKGKEKDKERVLIAIEEAVSSPLLNNSNLQGAKGLIVHTTTAEDSLLLGEQGKIQAYFKEYMDADADIKFGYAEIPTLDPDEIRITIIATGLQPNNDSAISNTPTKANNNLDEQPKGVMRSGRDAIGTKLNAASFKDQTVTESFKTTPAFYK